VIEPLTELAKGKGVTLAQFALAWTVHQPGSRLLSRFPAAHVIGGVTIWSLARDNAALLQVVDV
jgi:aryl-alcohol dehydrogenase-like predicted oxidoreductase